MSQTTKRALEESLKHLLLQKPIDKITINDIAEDCGINRMTFYYHFKDIYDLVEWSCYEDASKALAGMKTYDTWQQGFRQIFEAVKENKPFIINVYRTVSREQIEKYLDKVTYDLLINVVNEEAKDMAIDEREKEFIAHFYEHAFVGLMLDWINNDMKEDPRIIIDHLSILMQGNFSRALAGYSTEKIHQNDENDKKLIRKIDVIKK
jgi:probable dihydroxyacetone kinase regulator